jgi:poly-beta-1,6-N-acetyl-D-glucosamine synthase
MPFVTTDRARDHDDDNEPDHTVGPPLSDTLVMPRAVAPVGGSAVKNKSAAARGRTATIHEPGTAVLDMSAFWPEIDAAEADRRARRKPRVGHVLVLIPAHNEARSIAQTLRSLRKQTSPPREVVVVCDNCTDDTARISAANGARVMSTVGNTEKKAGALNQALDCILPQVGRDDLILAMDADSQLSRDWIRKAAQTIASNPKLGAVCGVFLGESGCGLIGQLQRNEYVRYARQVGRRRQAPVLSGTGTLFRVRALREVARERGGRLPGKPGRCYSTISITEDNEITLALKTIGYRCWPVAGCDTLTELMPTWTDLFRQRLRWQRGTLTDLRTYGISLVTAGYWAKQLFIYLAIAATISTWVIMCMSIGQHIAINATWSIAIGSLALLERLITVRKAGLLGLLLAALLIPEFAYDIFKLSFFLRALYDNMRRRDIHWNHVV